MLPPPTFRPYGPFEVDPVPPLLVLNRYTISIELHRPWDCFLCKSLGWPLPLGSPWISPHGNVSRKLQARDPPKFLIALSFPVNKSIPSALWERFFQIESPSSDPPRELLPRRLRIVVKLSPFQLVYLPPFPRTLAYCHSIKPYSGFQPSEPFPFNMSIAAPQSAQPIGVMSWLPSFYLF